MTTARHQDRNEVPLQPTQLAFCGGIRAHGHVLPSAPPVTRELGPSTYLVEGVLFNIHGDREIVFGVVGPTGADKTIRRFGLLQTLTRYHWARLCFLMLALA